MALQIGFAEFDMGPVRFWEDFNTGFGLFLKRHHTPLLFAVAVHVFRTQYRSVC